MAESLKKGGAGILMAHSSKPVLYKGRQRLFEWLLMILPKFLPYKAW